MVKAYAGGRTENPARYLFNTTKGTRSSGNPEKYIVFGVSVCVCVCTPEYDRPTLGDNPLRLAIALTMVLMTYLQNHIHGHIISE